MWHRGHCTVEYRVGLHKESDRADIYIYDLSGPSLLVDRGLNAEAICCD
jgi:hypothetical protein